MNHSPRQRSTMFRLWLLTFCLQAVAIATISAANSSTLAHRRHSKTRSIADNHNVTNMNSVEARLLRIERKDEKILEDLQKKITSIESKLAESTNSFNYLTIISTRHNSRQTDEISSLSHEIRAIAKSVDDLHDPVHTRSEAAHVVEEVTDDVQPPAGCSATSQRGRSEAIQRIRASPAIGANTFYVLCSAIDDLQPYTVILNRNSAALEFYRNWDEYRNGFGNVAGDHWIGLDRLSEITNGQLHELHIVLEDSDGLMRYASYDSFAIGTEQQQYPLSVLGKFSGQDGDAFSFHAGHKFSTFDVDNDMWTGGNCAQTHGGGGWWYDDCDQSNLMGQYNTNSTESNEHHMYWGDRSPSLKRVVMMIRALP